MFESDQHQSSLLSSREAVKRERWQRDPLWISAIREEGRRLFEKMGLPNLRQEEWKYTDVSAVSQQVFSPPTPLAHSLPGNILQDVLFPKSLSPLRLVFVNGFYSPSLSQVVKLPEGVETGSLAGALNRNHPLPQKHLAAYAEANENSFVALNNAFIEDGAFVYIPAGVRIEYPLHLVYISLEKGMPGAHYPRNLIIAEKGSAVTVIEDYIGNDKAAYLNNPVTEIVVDDGARVDHYKLQRESEEAFHIASIQVSQGMESHFASHSVTFGGQLTRNNIHSYLTGPDASCTFNGLFMIDGTRHVDNHTLIHHSAPACRSWELYHGILDDSARGVFNGKIYVRPEAQKTDSQQTNRSLMLSNDSRMDAKPQLEIFADDVKCSHGATVGRIDSDALYYLRSRGVSEPDARKMLTLAFGRQVTNRFELEPLRKTVERLLASRLEERVVNNK